MTAGLPGAGIGGVFYVASALAMPVAEAFRWVRGRRHPERPPARWGLALRQAALAMGILAGLAATGWALAFVLPGASSTGGTLPEGIFASPSRPSNAVRAAAVLLSFLTLTAVLGVVEALRLFRRLARRRGRP